MKEKRDYICVLERGEEWEGQQSDDVDCFILIAVMVWYSLWAGFEN